MKLAFLVLPARAPSTWAWAGDFYEQFPLFREVFAPRPWTLT